MQDAPKAVRSIPYVSVAFSPSLKQNFIAYRSSKLSSRPDCIFEIQQLWQSGFSRVYSNSYCRCTFEPEIIKIGQSSHKMYSNNIMNFQESTTILNAWTKYVLKLIEGFTYIYIYKAFNTFTNIMLQRVTFCLFVFIHRRWQKLLMTSGVIVPSYPLKLWYHSWSAAYQERVSQMFLRRFMIYIYIYIYIGSSH